MLLRYNPVEYGFIILAQKLIVMKRQIVSMQKDGGAIGKGGVIGIGGDRLAKELQ